MTEQLPILYSFKRCPYAIRARMALALAQITHIHREINLKNKAPALLELSPKGTVPVFHHRQQHLLLEESYDIVCYALSHHLPAQWISVADAQQSSFFHFYTELGDITRAIRQIKYSTDATTDQSLPTQQINHYLQALNHALGPKHTVLSQPSLLDVLIFPNIRQLWIHDAAWFERFDHHHVERWLIFWSQHPVFRSIFVTQPVWDEQQPAIIIQHG